MRACRKSPGAADIRCDYLPERPNKERSFVMIRPSLFALVALIAMLTGCAAKPPSLALQDYVPTTRELLPLGQLHLSNRELKLDSLEGAMQLEFAGIMPESAGPDIAGSSVYRVKNAEDFFRKNTGKSAFCDRMPRWVAVNSPTGAPAWSDEIWLGMLTLDDWARFTHGEDQVCIGGDYVRTSG
jgi:hypothetical protein